MNKREVWKIIPVDSCQLGNSCIARSKHENKLSHCQVSCLVVEVVVAAAVAVAVAVVVVVVVVVVVGSR